MDFSQALIEMKKGNKVYRHGWNGVGLVVYMVRPTEYNDPCPHFIIADTNSFHKRNAIWVPSTSDLLADDWEVI